MTTALPIRPFLRPLRLRLTSLVIAAGLATVIAAAPSRAQITGENIGGLIAGAVALGIIAKALDDQNRRDRERERARAASRNQTPVHTPITPSRPSARALPGECLTAYSVRGETVRYFPAACLDRNYRDADRLPAACRQTIRTPGGNAAVYAPACLRDRGFQVEMASGPGRGNGHGQWRHDRHDWR
jgi:hypothetical protein